MAEKIEIKGDAIGSAVGAGARVRARDITVYKDSLDKSSMEEQWRDVLKKAREALEEANLTPADKDDVLDDFGKLTTELENPERNAGRIARYFKRVQELAPSAASILASVTSLAQLLTGQHPSEQS